MDLSIFQFINDFAGRWGWLDQLAIFIAASLPVLLVVILVGIWITRKNHRMAFVAFFSAMLARGVFVTLIRFFYERPRPIPVDAVHRLVVNTQWAFPSGHAAFFFALAMGVYFYNKKIGIIYFIAATLIGLARIFIGVHWPTDILAGAILGILTACLVQYISNRYSKRVWHTK